ncbi:plasmid replication initiator TrfA [Pseudomonas aeruginosa]|uniref:plasmid replication initiator TrfA n=1 Tax=Pseudomonas aeruginosa TaxID=287 RepID=UPI000F52AC41|nr:plasmid replication initiator TrfA [Pseudomonas aeruginosa]RQG73516.1 TrfA protein [Pseudomonas aeruginosa]
MMPLPARIVALLEERNKFASGLSLKNGAKQHRGLLPHWPDSVRRVPNVALRSALFGAIRKGHRPYLERVEIHAQGGISILYTGVHLDQGDLDVWETVLHMARAQELGTECRVTAYRLLKELGRTDTGKNRQILDKHLSRLKATALQVRVGEHSYEGSLVHEVYRDHGTRGYVIRLDPKLRMLFVGDQFTEVDWSVRQSLHGKPLAQWLHGFYASHANPFPLKVETLHRLCGSRASSLCDFKKDLRRALNSLAEASSNEGQPLSYEIQGDLVRVKTTPSPSQRRHLARKR